MHLRSEAQANVRKGKKDLKINGKSEKRTENERGGREEK